MSFDLAETDRLLSTTRAVRKRLDLTRDVPNDVLLDCIRLSQQAPTGSNIQGWRWMIVRDAAKRQALADLYRKAGSDYLSEGQKQAEAFWTNLRPSEIRRKTWFNVPQTPQEGSRSRLRPAVVCFIKNKKAEWINPPRHF